MKHLRRGLLALAIVLALVWLLVPRGPEIQPGSILVIDVEGEYVEAPQSPLVSRLFADAARPFVGLLSELAKAGRDDRIEAVVLRIRPLGVGWAKAQEIREAIAELGASGRRTVAYLELASFGANLEYYVASAASEIYAEPATRAPVIGLAAEYLFLGGLWERFGVELEVERIGRYKTAAETLAGRGMSEAGREMADALLDSIEAQFLAGIAEGRRLPPEAVRRAIDAAPVDPSEMQSFGLIDGTAFLDELYEKLGGGNVVLGSDYAQLSPESVGFDPVARFALVYGSGNVVVGSGSQSPGGSPVLASDTVSKALADAAADPEIDAIIFRIDSPGGSPLAADIVWRASVLAQRQDKPLVASFSDVAASGGYYVAAGADAIFASPGTLTGSIGVFVLRPVLAGLFDKLDIGIEALTRGEHADLQLASRPLDDATRERLRAEVASIYELFVTRVADGRALSREDVDAVARGRVWTGEQAAEVGLVTDLGGMRAAVARARSDLGLDPDADVALVPYPRPKSVIEQVGEALRGTAARLVPLGPDAQLLRRMEPWLGAAADGAPAALLPFLVEIR